MIRALLSSLSLLSPRARIEKTHPVSLCDLVVSASAGPFDLAPYALDVDLPCAGSSRQLTPMMQASFLGNRDLVEALLDVSANVNATSFDGWTALMFAAAAKGGEGCVKLLLDAGAEVDAANDVQYTALFMSAADCNDQVVDMLVAAGADPNRQDKRGATPLSVAQSSNCSPAVMEALA
jgi:ankyrin repeat protein